MGCDAEMDGVVETCAEEGAHAVDAGKESYRQRCPTRKRGSGSSMPSRICEKSATLVELVIIKKPEERNASRACSAGLFGGCCRYQSATELRYRVRRRLGLGKPRGEGGGRGSRCCRRRACRAVPCSASAPTQWLSSVSKWLALRVSWPALRAPLVA